MKTGLGPSSDVAPAAGWPPGTAGRPADRRRRRRVVSLVLAAVAVVCAGVVGALATSPTPPHHSAPRSTTSAIHGGHPLVGRGVAPVGLTGRWRLVFDDEFGGTALDRSKWSTGWFGSGITPAVNRAEQDCYDPAQVAVSGGAVRLTAVARPETCDGVTQPFASGLISTNTKFQFTYGAFEARIWLPGSGNRIADWPAFWADGHNWPVDGEIDALEGLGGSPCYHFNYSGGSIGRCATVPGAESGWHTYAADWAPGSITYYYDGREVGRVTTGVTSAPMYLILSLSVSRWLSPPPVVPATMQVDYVRAWQRSG